MNRELAYDWLFSTPVAVTNAVFTQFAQERQAQLTKPPKSLGRLEELAIHLATLQQTRRPSVDSIFITIFAGDHGIVAENVSAFSQSVTVEMIKNFTRSGAAINVLARAQDAVLEIINLGTVNDTSTLPVVRNYNLGPGTANFLYQPAMTADQLEAAMHAGHDAIERISNNPNSLFIGGEMGIGNTTSATALACCLLNIPPAQLTGSGTGLDARGIAHKISVISKALACHQHSINSPLEALRYFGGFEIAALTGAYLHCAQIGIPVLVDGFISTVAALLAESIKPGCQHWFIYSHISQEKGHRFVLDKLNAQPLLDLQMRLGEGSGAAVAVSLLKLACRLHNEMATFTEAQVSEKI
ncbi:nicotinate-nucleotide-dimethylbenzimidazole phosphoribosyltransferase [Nitrosomonas sp. PY1]|uniref:nicotinate-nucleotide--dimethylbenzimidazole phosphoribosyltransferase n=1 Tax=Nitrosomonas sp. PY1 TaxID=1803906 RepID=UPI001FC8856A|nr:nicotinate-nucleotide--dimethylbenzimidazole phosphoribosyltransferase [Nitrosomonas sp. PY1]GKS69910.1 nicotinate-nucleotide-dimethylbenzimidazole phosphoribosyltransferase [Nitrosomonas sp. PY1]